MNAGATLICSFLLFWTAPVADAPRVLHLQTPDYPAIAWQNQVHGNVSLRILVHPDGRFAFVDSGEGPPLLVSAAKENLCSWTFAASDSQEPVPMRVEFDYRIDRERSSDRLTSEVTFDLPTRVTIVAPSYSAACVALRKRSHWRFWDW